MVKIIIDGINIESLINQDGRFSSNEILQLPNECGRIEVVQECFKQLVKMPKNDYTNELIGIINNNPHNNLETWLEYTPQFKGPLLTKWLGYAYKLQLIHRIDETKLIELLEESQEIVEIKKRLQFVISGNRIEIIEKDPNLKKIVFESILSNEIRIINRRGKSHSFNFLSLILNPNYVSLILKRENNMMTLKNHFNDFSDRFSASSEVNNEIFEFNVVDDIDKIIKKLNDSLIDVFNLPVVNFTKDIVPWDVFIENTRSCIGDQWIVYIIATISAGIISKETYEDYIELNDSSKSLCKRIRCARMKSGNSKYWENHLLNSENKLFTLLVFFTWATPKTIINLFPIVSKIIKSIDKISFSMLVRGIMNSIGRSTFDKTQQIYIEKELSDKVYEDEMKYIISLRIDGNEKRNEFIYKNIEKSSGKLKKTFEIKFQYLIDIYLHDSTNIEVLKEIRSLYKNIQEYDDVNYYRYNHHRKENIRIPFDIAKTIMEDCRDYPKIISSLAEKSCRLYANEHLEAVGKIASVDKWFENV